MIKTSELIQKNKRYWDRRALRYGLKREATLLDNNMRLLEIDTVRSWLNKDDCVLDIGCGNGISSIAYAKSCCFLKGIDLSKGMVKAATLLLEKYPFLKSKVEFSVENILNPVKAPRLFNTVVSVRCLINLPTWELQKKAIRNIYHSLPWGGKFIFIEGIRDGLVKINEFRNKLKLPSIKEPWYNNHFRRDRTLKYLKNLFQIESERNIDAYFLISRVFYPSACYPAQPSFRSRYNTAARLLAERMTLNTGTTLLAMLCLIKKRPG